MYVLYSDESGKPHNPGDNVVVVAGIGVHEDAVRPLAGEINGILERHLGHAKATQIEVHGNPMRSGRGAWRSVSRPKRIAVAAALLDLVAGWIHPASQSAVLPFAVIVDQGRSSRPIELGYAELLHCFDARLRAKRRGGDSHNGILVADRGQHEAAITAWVEVARARPRRPVADRRRLHALVETPFFIDSGSTRLMQLADLVGYALYRAYNADDWAWADHLLPSIGAGAVLHMPTTSGCVCVACRTDRVRGMRGSAVASRT